MDPHTTKFFRPQRGQRWRRTEPSNEPLTAVVDRRVGPAAWRVVPELGEPVVITRTEIRRGDWSPEVGHA